MCLTSQCCVCEKGEVGIVCVRRKENCLVAREILTITSVGVCVRARLSVCEQNIEGVFVCECDVHFCQLVEVAQTPIPGFCVCCMVCVWARERVFCVFLCIFVRWGTRRCIQLVQPQNITLTY